MCKLRCEQVLSERERGDASRLTAPASPHDGCLCSPEDSFWNLYSGHPEHRCHCPASCNHLSVYILKYFQVVILVFNFCPVDLFPLLKSSTHIQLDTSAHYTCKSITFLAKAQISRKAEKSLSSPHNFCTCCSLLSCIVKDYISKIKKTNMKVWHLKRILCLPCEEFFNTHDVSNMISDNWKLSINRGDF